MRQTLPLMALLLTAATLTAHAGQIFKYVDAQGRIHYADRPQPGWQRIEVRVPPANPTPPRAEAAGGAAPAASAGETPPPAPAPAADALTRAAECGRKQEQLKTYSRATRIVESDSEGKSKEYGPADREKLLASLEQDIKKLCGAAG